MRKINEKEYDEEYGVENRIFGKQLPTILLFTDDDKNSEWFRSIYHDDGQFKVDTLHVESYEININECPNLANEWHVGPADCKNPKLSAAPVLIVNFNTEDFKHPESKRFDNHDFAPIETFIKDYKEKYGYKGADDVENKVKEIRSWLKEKYPGGFPNGSYNEPDFEDMLEELGDFVKYWLLGICGCGCQGTTIKAIRDYLSIIYDRTKKNDDAAWEDARTRMKEVFGVSYPSDDPLLQYMAYDLDERGLTDHGSGINGAWISTLGEKCLFILDLLVKKEEEDEEDGSEPKQ